MSNYNAPDVYIKDVVKGSQSVSQLSSSVGILIGVTRSGVVNKAQKIGSWTEFLFKYANGLDTPFMENSYLPYAVYGFFNNGGKELYIGSVKKEANKATVTSATNNLKVTALTEGTWGNEIQVILKKSQYYVENTNEVFDVTISVGSGDKVILRDVTLQTITKAVLENSKSKEWIGEFSYDSSQTPKLAEETFTLTGGTNGSPLQDADYVKALEMIDVLDDVTMVAVVGQTTNVVNDALLSYCDNHQLFPIIDMPLGSTPEQVRAYRMKISAFTGALTYPWGKVSDPLTNTLKIVPTAGHVMGVYARVIENRGIHKAPAGIEAVVRGFVELEMALTPAQLSSLNPVGVVCIVSKPNAGIVLWGARSLNSTDTTMRYVTDGLINLNIKKSLYRGTQFAVFEPNDNTLWGRVQATCKAFLETLRLDGTLKGTAKEAYYVKVDESNNTASTIADGELHIEIGYAPVKPAEFVIFKLAHSIEQ